MDLVLGLGLVLVGCQRQNQVELTLVAQNISLQTQIAAVQATATVDTERLQITVDYMNTLVGRAENQSSQLQATQSARTTQTDNQAVATPYLTPNPGDLVTPQETPVADNGQSALVDITMAPGVGDNDCAVNPTSEFSTSSDSIYVVATALNIQAGTHIAARFSIAGQEISHDFTPDFDINGNCVWFYIDQTDLPFTAGTWSVTLELNGIAVSAPIPFSITESG